jgi:hypothetical protein
MHRYLKFKDSCSYEWIIHHCHTFHQCTVCPQVAKGRNNLQIQKEVAVLLHRHLQAAEERRTLSLLVGRHGWKHELFTHDLRTGRNTRYYWIRLTKNRAHVNTGKNLWFFFYKVGNFPRDCKIISFSRRITIHGIKLVSWSLIFNTK